ncbi:MAG: helix-turn-helix domain-containing protein [Piscirickettsiaceae bacterium]|jgi:excisionase family DNA binding protein|nr:helix-turn-helix domain-containing protein [Piscirickettsiaceae bacterium]
MKTKENLITPEQAAEYLGMSPKTMNKWRSTGENNIPYSKIGRSVRYRLSDLDAYIAKHSHNVEVK